MTTLDINGHTCVIWGLLTSLTVYLFIFANPFILRSWWKAPLIHLPWSDLTLNSVRLHWTVRQALDQWSKLSLCWPGFGRDAEFDFYHQTMHFFEQRLCVSNFFANGLFIHWMFIILWGNQEWAMPGKIGVHIYVLIYQLHPIRWL